MLLEQTPDINVKNLCSRKLWELLAKDPSKKLNQQEKNHIHQELLSRQHYLKEINSWLTQNH
jgi:hypothetical protein